MQLKQKTEREKITSQVWRRARNQCQRCARLHNFIRWGTKIVKIDPEKGETINNLELVCDKCARLSKYD